MKAGIEEYVREGKQIPLDRLPTREEALMPERDFLKYFHDLTDQECEDYLALRKQRKIRQITQKRAENRNGFIEREALLHMNEGISVTRGSYSKLEHIVDTFDEMLKSKGKPSHEIMLAMTASKSSIDEGYPVIDDFIITPDQSVTPTFCTGGGSSFLSEFDHENKGLVGWTHSHGGLNTFFSSQDRRQVATHTNTTYMPLDYMFDNEFCSATVNYYPSIVVNNNHDEPFTTVSMDIPVYEATGPGTYRIKEYKRIDVDNVPINFVGEDSYIRTEENTQEIEEKLKSRVGLGSMTNYLGKLYDEDFKPHIDYRQPKKMSFAELKRRTQGPREDDDQNYAPSSEQESSYEVETRAMGGACDALECLEWDDYSYDDIYTLEEI